MNTQSPIARKAYPHAFEPPSHRKPSGEGRATDLWRWKRKHPRQWAWIKENADRSPFAFSLARGLHEFGIPTPAQQQALDRIVQEAT